MLKISVEHKSYVTPFKEGLSRAKKIAAYVGIPHTTAQERMAALVKMSAFSKRALQLSREKQEAGNAEILHRFSKGTPFQPPRPLLEPSIEAHSTEIGKEMAGVVAATLANKQGEAITRLNYVAQMAQNNAREWFFDPRNNWAPNSPVTIALKGSGQPGIDTGLMRSSIVGIVGEDKGENK
jgi:hypothetical protein